MIILKILYCILLFLLLWGNLITLQYPYIRIKEIKTNSLHHTSHILVMEIILFIPLIILGIIINEEQFIFNIKETFLWAGGFFLFVYVHLIIVILIASYFMKKEGKGKVAKGSIIKTSKSQSIIS